MIYLLSLFVSFSVFSTSDIKCEAQYDQMGIPHQKVSNLHDFYYCFGYHHGKDRAWEMDYFKRVGHGRNAEIYGFSFLKSDLMMRLLDLPKLADRLYKGMPDQHKGWLAAYANGVNLGFQTGKNAKEFQDKDYAPEEWKAEDSVLILLLQSFDQTRKTFFFDYEEEKFKERWKEKSSDLFDEDHVPWINTILKEGEYEKGEVLVRHKDESSGVPKLWATFPEVFGKESGSNNWVISKEKSKNGYAILANDPHLDLKTPLFWYWIKLEAPDFQVMGASVPGVPFVASGTNGNVAWGLTNAYINTADAVYVKDVPEDYLESFRPTVKVKFGFLQLPFFFKSFERTKEGHPVLPLDVESSERIFLKWTGFTLESEDLLPMFDFVHLKNVDEMNSSLKKVGLPAWNFVFADTQGDIGYRVVGEAFRHTEKIPYGISTVSIEEFRKNELLDPEDRPHVLKPKRHYIYTANNRHWPVDAKFYGGRGYSYSFRGFRIDELLQDGKHDVASFQKIQCDRQAVDARFFVEKILKNIHIPEIAGWDFQTDENSTAPSYYRHLMELMKEEWEVNEYALYKMLDNLSADQKRELKEFYEMTKTDVNGHKWGDFHRLTFAHMSKNDDWKFSPELAGFGDNHSVDPGTSKWNEERSFYEQYSGASQRMIIVLKKIPEIHLSLPGLNRNYSEEQPQTPAWKEWRDCKYNKISW